MSTSVRDRSRRRRPHSEQNMPQKGQHIWHLGFCFDYLRDVLRYPYQKIKAILKQNEDVIRKYRDAHPEALGVNFTIMFPEVATDIIERHLHFQRQPNPFKLKRFITVMSGNAPKEKWRIGDGVIIFDTNRDILNGQHRILACRDGCTPFITMIRLNAHPDERSETNKGVPEHAGDMIAFAGLPCYSDSDSDSIRFRKQRAFSGLISILHCPFGSNTRIVSTEDARARFEPYADVILKFWKIFGMEKLQLRANSLKAIQNANVCAAFIRAVICHPSRKRDLETLAKQLLEQEEAVGYAFKLKTLLKECIEVLASRKQRGKHDYVVIDDQTEARFFKHIVATRLLKAFLASPSEDLNKIPLTPKRLLRLRDSGELFPLPGEKPQ